MKKLKKSGKDRIFSGVIGGLGEYLNIDSVVLRIVWVGITVFTGFFPGIIIYFFAVLLIPDRARD